jgi:hypothetical protein
MSSEHTMVFVGGLHRSGTTPLTRCLAAHPEVSGLARTGVPEDEGQHLQDVYATRATGVGPDISRATRRPGSPSPVRSRFPESVRRLWQAWAPHWDLSRRVLVEKSPPNLLMTRFLLRLFPDAAFVMIMRHPVVVTLSTAKWVPHTPLPQIMHNWFAAHDAFSEDVRRLPRVRVLTYEELVARPVDTLVRVGEFLGLNTPIPHETLRSDRSAVYCERWAAMANSRRPMVRGAHAYMTARYSRRARHYGYSLDDLDQVGSGVLA